MGLKSTAKAAVKAGLGPVLRNRLPRRTDLPHSLWDLTVNAEGHLSAAGFDLDALVHRHGSPLHVVRADQLRRNAADYQSQPDIEVYSSYKTNPIPGVLRVLHDAGVGAEVISHYELWLALHLGVDPSRIIYNGPAKSDESLQLAIDKDVLINLNAPEELQRVVTQARALGKRPRIGLRVASSGGWSGQFGVPLSEAMDALKLVEATAEVELVGLHAHRGGAIDSLEVLHGYVDEVLGFESEVCAALGRQLPIVNFGGSLACPSVRTYSERDRRMNMTFLADLVPPDVERALWPRAYVAELAARVRAHFQKAGRPQPRIMVEPGRGMTANTQTLVTSVMDTKASREGFDYAVLDAGINLAECVRYEFHQLFSVNRARLPAQRQYRLVGPICTPGDVLYHAWRLPELRAGDTLAIMDAGAYFVPFSTSFSFARPAIVLLDGTEERVIRRAETFEDLVARDV